MLLRPPRDKFRQGKVRVDLAAAKNRRKLSFADHRCSLLPQSLSSFAAAVVADGTQSKSTDTLPSPDSARANPAAHHRAQPRGSRCLAGQRASREFRDVAFRADPPTRAGPLRFLSAARPQSSRPTRPTCANLSRSRLGLRPTEHSLGCAPSPASSITLWGSHRALRTPAPGLTASSIPAPSKALPPQCDPCATIRLFRTVCRGTTSQIGRSTISEYSASGMLPVLAGER